ncbi:hypothetical protein [Streptomyces sp. NBC_00038]|uniref:hypothetical protein n=1 Tax=Streptomyces sp. NBC_00038 TaxID=2903615 RepID=UPI00225C3C10|nr:hypothetical protein [Streptomyces sp. NBC_00038]MCX5562729.1 hypothetical protein [Streptomyces sp. NBC_00038]MCX5563621.1 hypothetical protein [Streptomyces sp. NBC_00038]
MRSHGREPLYGDLAADLAPWGVTPLPAPSGAREVLWLSVCTGLGKTAALRGAGGSLAGEQEVGRLI